jgi:hypothetical protein
LHASLELGVCETRSPKVQMLLEEGFSEDWKQKMSFLFDERNERKRKLKKLKKLKEIV